MDRSRSDLELPTGEQRTQYGPICVCEEVSYMNSLRAHGSDDKLACLVQATLKVQVSKLEPSERVWKRIKLKLERNTKPLPGQCDDVGLVDGCGPAI
jgi:hypothetical protein